jgi:hypothetical protein
MKKEKHYNVAFCSHCGQQLQSQGQPNKRVVGKPTETPFLKLLVSLILIFTLLIAVATAGHLAYTWFSGVVSAEARQ